MSVGEFGISGRFCVRVPTGVNQNVPALFLVTPVARACWPTLLGRQGPASEIWPQFARLGVHGRPLPQVKVLVTCQPPIAKAMARPASPMNLLPLPTGNS